MRVAAAARRPLRAADGRQGKSASDADDEESRERDGECRAQVTQERKPHPMVEVCQLTDVRGECAVGRGGRWRALFWKGGDVRGDDSWRSRTLFTPSEVVGGIGHWSGVSYLSYY